MSKDPAFLFYSQDFLIGTAELSHEEVGQYLRILLYLHQKGPMTEKTICLLVGSVSVSVKSKFAIDSAGFWSNKRLEKEIEKRQKYTESRRSNGLKGGRPKALSKEKPYALHKDKNKKNHMVNHMEDENDNENKDELKDKEGIGGKKEKFRIKTISPPELESFFDVIGMSNRLTKDQVNLGWSEFSEANAEFDFDDITHAKRMFSQWITKKKFNNEKRGTPATTNHGRSQNIGRNLDIK